MKLIMTNERFDRFIDIFSNPFKFNGLLMLFTTVSLCLAAPGSLAGEPGDLVGEVSLVLGKSFIESPDRDRRQVEVGSPIGVGDQIVTGANGHVHIRFVDQALVSVRPDSQLEVVRYHYDASRPERSTVKFNLVEGVTRSISGEAARSARQRFRLNTPIAAIGVRGTDFVVSATRETVRALVNEGIIVMAPYSDGCSADALGPCADNAIELRGESLQILELSADAPAATPATHERNPGALREEVQLVIADSRVSEDEDEADELTAGNDVYLEGVTSQRVTEDARQVVRSNMDPQSDTAPVDDFTPAQQLTSEVLTDRQLVWGRWSWSEGQGEAERITLPYAEAATGRTVAINPGGDYGLFREEGEQGAQVDAGLGVIGFGLASAQAFYSSESGIVAMQVSDGELNIDFDRRTFATELSLEHASTGLIDFSAMGRIYSGGYFYDRSESQNVVGAVSLDGQEAGYYFNKQLETGGIQGLTLWDSR